MLKLGAEHIQKSICKKSNKRNKYSVCKIMKKECLICILKCNPRLHENLNFDIQILKHISK